MPVSVYNMRNCCTYETTKRPSEKEGGVCEVNTKFSFRFGTFTYKIYVPSGFSFVALNDNTQQPQQQQLDTEFMPEKQFLEFARSNGKFLRSISGEKKSENSDAAFNCRNECIYI